LVLVMMAIDWASQVPELPGSLQMVSCYLKAIRNA
jgi:hypothetical protein